MAEFEPCAQQESSHTSFNVKVDGYPAGKRVVLPNSIATLLERVSKPGGDKLTQDERSKLACVGITLKEISGGKVHADATRAAAVRVSRW